MLEPLVPEQLLVPPLERLLALAREPLALARELLLALPQELPEPERTLRLEVLEFRLAPQPPEPPQPLELLELPPEERPPPGLLPQVQPGLLVP